MSKEWFYKKNKYVILAFMVPFVILTAAFAMMKVLPFGNRQMLVTDLWHQYYPFLVDLQDKLKQGESLFWSWTQGGGVNYFALMSYYLMSPLNFLSVFVPTEFLREFLLFAVIVRISLAGMLMSVLLRYIYNKNDISIVLFGNAFSFCAFFMGYYWNIIWLDAVCLTPLLVFGVIKLLKEDKFKVYVVALSLSLLTNYYIGYFSCLFMLILFICYCVMRWEGKKIFLSNLLKMAFFSLIAIGMAAIILLPAFMGLKNTYATESVFPREFAINIGESNDLKGIVSAFLMVISNLISFSAPGTVDYEALPNIACGTIILVFVILFFTMKNISRKEKTVSLCLVVFFILSFIIRQLDYVWHGFHFVNMMPYRFSYLLSFVLIIMAFRAYTSIEAGEKFKVIAVILAVGSIAGIAVWNHADTYAIIGTIVIALIISTMFLLKERGKISKAIFLSLFAIIIVCESGLTAYIGIDAVRTTSAETYPEEGRDVGKIVNTMENLEKGTPEMWRAETSSYQTLNDSSLNKYRGLSMFSSMANVNMTRFYENIGLMGWKSGNRYTYAESSPVANVFMNLKYLIARNEKIGNSYDLKEVKTEGNVKLYENEHYLPMGFMTDASLKEWVINDEEDQFNPFDTQSEFFRLATGIQEPLYTPVQVATQGHTDYEQFPVGRTAYGNYEFHCTDESVEPSLKWNFEVPESGLYFAYAKITNGDDVSVTKRAFYGDEPHNCGEYYMKRGYIVCAGYADKGEILSVSTKLPQGQSGTAQVYMNYFNQDVFEKGYERIKQDVMTTTKLSGNKMEGTIDVENAGLFYTSVPYEKGWSAKVDGKEVEITPVGNALLAFPLEEGKHDISLEYYPEGFRMGMIITIFSVCIFAGISIWEKRKKRNFWNLWK